MGPRRKPTVNVYDNPILKRKAKNGATKCHIVWTASFMRTVIIIIHCME